MNGSHDSDAPEGAGRRAPRDDEPPRSVATEAALLVELLSRQGSFTATSGGPGARPGSGADPAGDSATPPEAGECSCGGSRPAACRVCPVCQVIAFVQKINPDTIERIADFASFAASALRDVASAQRTASSPAADTRDAAEPAPGAPAHPDDPADPADPADPGAAGSVRGDRP